MTEKQKVPYNKGIMSKLREHFLRFPGQPHHVGELAQLLGVTENQIRQAMNNIMATYPDDGIQRVIPARTWQRVNGIKLTTPSTGRRMYEEIGPTKDGAIVIQDDGGKLYRATEL